MEKALFDFVAEKAKAMLAVPYCYEGLKAAAQAWLDDPSEEMTKKLVAEIEADLMPVDSLLAFAESENAVKAFGAEQAKGMADHARELKAAGSPYCDCEACSPAAAILEKKAELLG